MESSLETDRLLLRRFTDADLDNLVDLDSDPEVMRYLTGGKPTSREKITSRVLPRFIDHPDQFWAAVDKASGEFLGWFALSVEPGDDPGDVELGYRLRRFAWGSGYATEGSRALVDHAFAKLGVSRVYAETMYVNTGSRRVMEKSGLRYVRTFHQHFKNPIPGTEHGEVEYELRRSDWRPDSR
ncbi:MAG: GNAT family N-acetyltransferase [Micromonosporaceae bacterium]